jgi:hypothetical protein
VCFDYAVTLSTDSGFEIRVETPFVLRDGSGGEVRINPEAPGDLAPRVLQLLHQLVDLVVRTTGELVMSFEGDHVITVSPDPRFEAWTLVGPKGQRVVCNPGGGTSEWSPSD